MTHQAGAYPGFCRMKQLGVFLLPPGWNASPSQRYPIPPSRSSTHLHTRVERGIKIPDILERSFPVRNFRKFGYTSQGYRGDCRFRRLRKMPFNSPVKISGTPEFLFEWKEPLEENKS